MVWGYMGYNSTGKIQFIEGTIDAKMHPKILQDNLFKSARLLGIEDHFYFNRITIFRVLLELLKKSFSTMYPIN